MTSNEYLSPFVSLEREDLHKAWEDGCPDVRKALRILYPRDLPPKAQERDVTGELEFVHERTFFIIKHNGVEVARQRKKSVVNGDILRIEFFLRPEERGNYKFKVFDSGNWQLIRIDG